MLKLKKGERKKPNVLSLKKLNSVLNLSLEMLIQLCEYIKEEIYSILNNSYSSMFIKKLLDKYDLEDLIIISELDRK